ncbi:Hpt domain-containing protein [Oceanicola sp. 22II-s10i]|uniref:Hpt domain-containing protein n=1 Tax=Oceanicola sp. 22II-s10i TaxID=1317116 RepID=UPI000B51FA6E|nr:Hpt domain-containing protein [Oceanicola sp. 22II-s10i]
MIDWTRLAALADEVGQDDFDDVVDLFLTDTADTVDALLPGPGLPDRLHYLKGSAATLGFVALARLCGRAEQTALAGGAVDLAAIRDTFRASRDLLMETGQTAALTPTGPDQIRNSARI